MEREHSNIGGLHIPLHQLQQRLDELKELDTIVIYCQVGQRSLIATKIALEQYPKKNIRSLTGGIVAWSKKHS